MATVLERAIAHYRDRPQHQVNVPEWGEGGSPLVVHFKTPTMETLSKARRDSGDDPVKYTAVLVAQCALDGKGERLFSAMNWLDLFKNADPAVVQRIGDAIAAQMNFDNAAVESAEKN